MFHLTIFSGTEGELAPTGTTVLTFFGGAELRRPTLAQQLVHYRASRGRARSRWDWLLGSQENIVVTIFGGTTVREPTLAEEHAALAAAVRSGQIDRRELPGLLDELEAHAGAKGALRTLTFFGACVVTAWKASKERKALDAAAETGAITAAARRVLETLVEAPRSVRWRALGELALTA